MLKIHIMADHEGIPIYSRPSASASTTLMMRDPLTITKLNRVIF
jgi:hypothetical protein